MFFLSLPISLIFFSLYMSNMFDTIWLYLHIISSYFITFYISIFLVMKLRVFISLSPTPVSIALFFAILLTMLDINFALKKKKISLLPNLEVYFVPSILSCYFNYMKYLPSIILLCMCLQFNSAVDSIWTPNFNTFVTIFNSILYIQFYHVNPILLFNFFNSILFSSLQNDFSLFASFIITLSSKPRILSLYTNIVCSFEILRVWNINKSNSCLSFILFLLFHLLCLKYYSYPLCLISPSLFVLYLP